MTTIVTGGNKTPIEFIKEMSFKEVERRVSFDLVAADRLIKGNSVAKSDLVSAIGYLLDALKEMELYVEEMHD